MMAMYVILGTRPALCADLNHVIHACTHPSWRDLPYYSEDEMLQQLERQVERIFSLVRWVHTVQPECPDIL